MNALQIFILVFVLIETLNLIELFFMKDKGVFNGVSIFSGWEKSKTDPDVHDLVCYLVNWVAGIKLIVVLVLGVLVFTAPDQTLIWAASALALAVTFYYWRLYPRLRKMRRAGQITPAKRPGQLTWMLTGLELGLIAVILTTVIG